MAYFESAIDGCQVGVRIDLETKYKVLRKFGRKDLTLAETFKEAICSMVEGVRLSASDRKAIEAEKAENFQRRMEKRAARDNKFLSTQIAYRKWAKPKK